MMDNIRVAPTEELSPSDLFGIAKNIALQGDLFRNINGASALITGTSLSGEPFQIQYSRLENEEVISVVGFDGVTQLIADLQGSIQESSFSKLGIKIDLPTVLSEFIENPDEIAPARVKVDDMEKVQNEGLRNISGFRLMEAHPFGGEALPKLFHIVAGSEEEAIRKYLDDRKKVSDFHAAELLHRGINWLVPDSILVIY